MIKNGSKHLPAKSTQRNGTDLKSPQSLSSCCQVWFVSTEQQWNTNGRDALFVLTQSSTTVSDRCAGVQRALWCQECIMCTQWLHTCTGKVLKSKYECWIAHFGKREHMYLLAGYRFVRNSPVIPAQVSIFNQLTRQNGRGTTKSRISTSCLAFFFSGSKKKRF